jgi:hypothetical protein
VSHAAPAQSAVEPPLLSQSPVGIRPQDTDVSVLPPRRLRHSARLATRLRFERPKRHRPDCVRCEDPWSTTGISSPRATPVRCSRSVTGASPVTATAGGDQAGTSGSAKGWAGTSSPGAPPA